MNDLLKALGFEAKDFQPVSTDDKLRIAAYDYINGKNHYNGKPWLSFAKVAKLHGVDAKELRKTVKRIQSN